MAFRPPLLGLTVALTIMNMFTLFAWWGFYLWLPSYLTQPASQGGVGLQLLSSSAFIFVMQAGMWFGYVTFGFVSDRIGRKRTYVTYLLAAAALLFLYVTIRNPVGAPRPRAICRLLRDRLFQRLWRGDGGDLSDRHPGERPGVHLQRRPSRQRRRPWAVGTLAQSQGYGAALSLSSAAFLAAALSGSGSPKRGDASWCEHSRIGRVPTQDPTASVPKTARSFGRHNI